MSSHEFTPARSTHAIVAAAFACELAAPVSGDIIESVVAAYDADNALKDLLPAKSEERGIKIELGTHAAQIGQPGELVGVRFERIAPDGLTQWSLSLRGNLMVVVCGDYSRWSDVMPQAVELFHWGLKTLAPFSIGFGAIGLEYQDEFLWLGEHSSMDAARLFNSATTLLPPMSLSRKGLWHNYSGWFDVVKSDPTRRLINLNIAFVQRADKGIAQIGCSHKALFDEAVEPPNEFSELFDRLHQEHKGLLGDLVSDSIKQKIRFDQ